MGAPLSCEVVGFANISWWRKRPIRGDVGGSTHGGDGIGRGPAKGTLGRHVPCLSVPSHSVTTVSEYISKAERILDEPSYAQYIVKKQFEVIVRLQEQVRFWEEIIGAADAEE